ncbi:MAG TPA: NAD-dependent epimerase/dehydratase family protein [Casimicrobiaceae bacterium]|nr:NAD-dependent epimerase/dehydratase family protein [Casimicrobiaceae bacterium]
MKRVVVTGCAGFIGSTMVDRLLANGHEVVGIDNFSSGQPPFLESALRHPGFRLVEGDLLDGALVHAACQDTDTIFHFAANADVRFGPDHPRRDLEQNTIVTHNVLEGARRNGVRRFAFSSTGSVYGEAAVIPTPEDAPFPVQTSLYGASKLACEGMIEAYAESFGIQAFVFRFVSILGERYTHGHVVDFYRQLRQDPTRLRVLGDGRQRKSYLYVHDCVDAVLLALERASARVNRYNLGVDSYCEVNDSIGWISAAMNVKPRLEYGGGDRGWIGDNPFIFLDTARIRGLGWAPKLSIRQGVERTVAFLRANEWVLERRP